MNDDCLSSDPFPLVETASACTSGGEATRSRRVIPVLDLLHGRVVRGIAGRRETYRPIDSPWSAAADPREVAHGLSETFGFREFYLADLDGIQRDTPQQSIYAELRARDRSLLVDAGVRDVTRGRDLLAVGIDRVILALETLRGPEALRELTGQFDSERLIFSLDLMHGRLLSDACWTSHSTPRNSLHHVALSCVETVVEAGLRSFIILDLAGVGMGHGIPTLDLCRDIRQRFPHLELVTGGGVTGADDLQAAFEAGVDAVLVASALHDGRLTRQELELFLSPAE